jgi:hypothetical protein
MSPVHRTAALLNILALVWIAAPGAVLAVQERAAIARPVLTDAQIEDFLLKAKIADSEEVDQGVTNTRRATLTDGQLTHDAQIQNVDIAKSVFQPDRGPSEINFRDSYRYNIAAYRLARRLGLHNVPVSIERRVERSQVAVTWWIDDVVMDEGARLKKQPVAPLSNRAAGQVHIMRVFDALIANTDRNLGNLLWTANGDMWMIDHTRAFRLDMKLRTPGATPTGQRLERVERGVFVRLRALDMEWIKRELNDHLTVFEMQGLLSRRDEIVKWFEGLIAQRGEAAVLFGLAPAEAAAVEAAPAL